MYVVLRAFGPLDLPLDLVAPVRLGPVVVAGDRAVVAAMVVAALVVSELWARRNGTRSDAAWAATWVGLGAARLAFVAAQPAPFVERPWEIVFVWQGGFVGWLGGLTAVAYAVASAIRAGGARELRARGIAPSAVAALVTGALAMAFLPAVPPAPHVSEWPAIQRLADGEAVDPARWVGTPTIVNLFATWCPPCRRELPMLVAWAQEGDVQADRGEGQVRIVIVSQGERPETVTSFLEAEGLPVDGVMLDPAGRLGHALGAVGLPTTIVLDPAGEVSSIVFGETSRARLEAALRAATSAVGDGER